MNTIGAYSKAFVPLIVMGFAILGNRFGINFGIGDAEANILIGLVTSWLVYLIPNTGKAVPQVVLQTPVVSVPPVIQEVVKPSILRKISK